MINLLPPDYAMQIRYGRHNAVLRLWLIGAAGAIGGLLIIILSGWIYFNHQSGNLNTTIAASQAQLTTQNLSGVQKNAGVITGDIKVINQVLGQEIRFSDLMQAIGNIMPPGSVLSSLTLGKINGALDLSATAKDSSSATQIAVNLGDPKNSLFSSVDIISINCSTTPSAYPCTVVLRTLFNKAAQTKFLSFSKDSQL